MRHIDGVVPERDIIEYCAYNRDCDTLFIYTSDDIHYIYESNVFRGDKRQLVESLYKSIKRGISRLNEEDENDFQISKDKKEYYIAQFYQIKDIEPDGSTDKRYEPKLTSMWLPVAVFDEWLTQGADYIPQTIYKRLEQKYRTFDKEFEAPLEIQIFEELGDAYKYIKERLKELTEQFKNKKMYRFEVVYNSYDNKITKEIIEASSKEEAINKCKHLPNCLEYKKVIKL